ncbi:nucleotidyltransferase [Brevibacillus brevis]|uniref:nucleotidyltransferase n=1 Tax=Brevibacillus brevis TaxID=1393 RepID=UPI000B3AC733|nr:nucleotidyltransferase [Brevibacillus brevis]OUQ85718.1 nucleotidyltransferase [Brevibacillus brevis]
MLKQKKIIEAVQEACKQGEQVTSCMMYGSFTKGEGDQYSDVEFYIFIEDSSFETFSSKQRVAKVAPYDLMFFNKYGTEVVIFSNLIRGEFHFLPASKLEIIKSFKPTGVFPDPDAMFIYDNTAMLRECLDYLGGIGPERMTDDNVTFAFHNFVNAWLLGINVLRRGELARSLEVLTYVQKYILQLLRINEQNVERWLNSSKNLERDLSPEAYEDYALMTARLRKDELEQAYTHALMLTDKLRKQLEPFYVFDVDVKMIGKLRDYLNQIE